MAKVLEIVVLLFGIVTLFFGILALSLDYWQGRTVTINEMVEWEISQYPKAKQWFADFKNQLAGVPFGSDMVMQQKDGNFYTDHMSRLLGVKMYLHVGLWHICVKDIRPKLFFGRFGPFTDVCVNMNDGFVETGMVYVAQLMFFLGIFLTIACLILVGIILISTEEKNRLVDITALIMLMAGIFYTAGFAYFVDNMAFDILDYQTAFYLGLFASLFCFLMTAMLLYLKFCKARGTLMT